ncbi:MAG: hypothetical protein NT082_06350, partial [Chloroflexi bacterium]|nr:hypothetical protein [Chloroflexota bacterium]
FKAAVEKAGGTDDMDKLIAAFETVSYDGVLGKERVEMTKVPGFFHSRVCSEPNNPKKLIPDAMGIGMAQVQANGEYIPMYPTKFAQVDKYKTPAQLRTEAGIK